jgi:hypothetical protein
MVCLLALLFIVSLNIGLEGDFLLCQGDWTVVACSVWEGS